MLLRFFKRFKIRKVSCVNNPDKVCSWLSSCNEFKKNKGKGIHQDKEAIGNCCTASKQLDHLLTRNKYS